MVFLISFLTKLFAVLLSFVVVLLSYVKWSHQYWARRNVPFLPPKIPFGNLERPSQKSNSIGYHVKKLYDDVKMRRLKHCGLYFFASPVYLVADLDSLKNVMTRDFQHFTDRGMYYNEKTEPISAHLFAIGGSKWRNLRSKLTPTFTSGKLKKMFPTLIECVGLLMETMEREATEIDVKELLGRFTTDIIGSCAFGLDCNTIKEENSPFRIYGKKVFTSSRLRTLKMSFVTNFPQIGRLFGVRQVASEISDFFTNIVKQTIEYRKENQFSRPDFMQMLIDLKDEGAELTIDEVVAQSFIFFLAGFETSSTTMTFALFELAKNKEMQDRLRREIHQVLQKHHGEITYEGLNEMAYLNQVLDETLRLYPPLPFITRTCVKDYRIPDANVTIEKGKRVIVPILGVHLDPEHYPNPEVFDPERFNELNKSQRHPYAHIPFGEGPRICIGMKFGLLQSKVGLVALLRKYRFSVNPRTASPVRMAINSFIPSVEGGIWLDSHQI